jgi:hypothetical protein
VNNHGDLSGPEFLNGISTFSGILRFKIIRGSKNVAHRVPALPEKQWDEGEN